ncbi:hypothetical protein ANCCAN_04638 [Ancylostoma caninum]|uniref:Peptidase M1 membrane alanine aminopeptidase domain-containing protein n=1 Tax=Ancylostoma caninum TaxID=29170 RepID=A0A368GXY8_ANCCA|nr:hypothetical protein ANCCAN_04638 [Ancylostoma caninum]
MVTPNDWGELWLNEGFATFFENTWFYTKNGGDLHRTVHATLSFDTALREDSFATSRPLCSIIDTPSEIFETFDGISYKKGAAILEMTASLMGEQKFRKALNRPF